MANSIKLFLCSLAFAAFMLNGLLAENKLEEISVEDEWNRSYFNIFSRKIGKPNLTLETLKRMEEIYPRLEQSVNGSSYADQYAKVKNLLRFGQPHVSWNCTLDSLKDFYQVINACKLYQQNIISYLRGWPAQWFTFCEPIYKNQLKEAVSRLTKQQREDAQLLVEKVRKLAKSHDPSKVRKISFTQFESDSGCLDYLKYQSLNKLGAKLTRFTSRMDFKQLFEDSIGNPCRAVKKQLEVPMQFYYMVYREKLAKQVDTFTLDWIAAEEVCRYSQLKGTMDNIFDKLNPEN